MEKGEGWCLTSLQTAETLTTAALTCQLAPVSTYYPLGFCGVRTCVDVPSCVRVRLDERA